LPEAIKEIIVKNVIFLSSQIYNSKSNEYIRLVKLCVNYAKLIKEEVYKD